MTRDVTLRHVHIKELRLCLASNVYGGNQATVQSVCVDFIQTFTNLLTQNSRRSLVLSKLLTLALHVSDFRGSRFELCKGG